MASSLLAAIAVVHGVWAAGSSWPFVDREALAAVVWGGPAATLPSPAATVAMAVLILVAALLVAGRGGLWGAHLPRWIFSVGTWGVATVLTLRAVVFGLGAIGSDAVNRTWELALFTPLCLLLGVLCATVASGGFGPRRTSTSRGGR